MWSSHIIDLLEIRILIVNIYDIHFFKKIFLVFYFLSKHEYGIITHQIIGMVFSKTNRINT